MGLYGLAACVAQPAQVGYALSGGPIAKLPAPAGRRIAVLVPLSGSNAELGRSMLRAAQLALQASGGSAFDEMDTKGTPDGAATAVRTAIAGGAGIIVGPLTAAETSAVASVTRPRNIPVLAFTSDSGRAESEVWTLGITAAQQVRTLVRAAQADGRGRIGALLPRNAFGDALASGLGAACQEAGLPAPTIGRYRPGEALDAAIAGVAAESRGTVDAMLLGTSIDGALAALPSLTKAGLGPDRVRLLGTALWSKDAPRSAGLNGAWFAGPDPATLGLFEQQYRARFGTAPPELSGVAFDAAGAARAVTGPTGVNASVLLTPGGFSGPNGTFVLLPDGHVRRALALFEIGADRVHQRTVAPEGPPPARVM